MCACIDVEKTGLNIWKIMSERGYTPNDVADYLHLTCVQTVYQWKYGNRLPTVDNLYALSEMLKVSMDSLICGDRATDKGSTDHIYMRMSQNSMAYCS